MLNDRDEWLSEVRVSLDVDSGYDPAAEAEMAELEALEAELLDFEAGLVAA